MKVERLGAERSGRTAAARPPFLRGLLLLGVAALATGCGGPELGSRAYERAKLIENMAEYRKPEQIQTAFELIESDAAEGEISEAERTALLAALDLADQGRWEDAGAAAKRLLVAQQRR
ncbi:MAG: hypothetical protein AAF907_04495 [Planctomycetota bacterium]